MSACRLCALLWLPLLGLLACAACGGSPRASGVEAHAYTMSSINSALLLPPPANLPRAGSFADGERFKDAAAFSAGLTHNAVSVEGSALRFSPDWDTAAFGSGMQHVALAVYGWSLAGYSGQPSLGLDWAAAPDADTHVWLGLANFSSGRWDWQALGGAASSASVAPLGSHLRAGDGAIYAAVLLAGPASADDPLLSRVYIGSSDSVVPGDITFTVDAGASPTPISPLIYGVNDLGGAVAAYAHPALSRQGGNRWTAYNWETNASNAGTDWLNQNDGYLSDSDTPGQAVKDGIDPAYAAGAAALITMPIQGYVAADKNGGGDVNQSNDYIHTRFRQNLPAKGSTLLLNPITNDLEVYQDEFLNWLNVTYPGKLNGNPPQLLISLDNEPDLWHSTHIRIQPDALGYDELIDKSIASMLAMRAVQPGTQFFGAVNYGWYGYETLQDAPDAGAHGNFIDYYLDRMAAAEQSHGQRLLNVLDVHWYPEAQGSGTRITGDDTSAAVVAARLQAPRSLWDSGYTEDSWISQWSTSGPIYLLPRLKQKIAAHYPGTKLAITEYNYGAGGHISGGLAEADALGAFGAGGVYAACIWPLSGDSSFIYGAMKLYRNADDKGGGFGDLSLPLSWDDYTGYSAYSAGFSTDSGRLSLVLINKQDGDKLARVVLDNSAQSYSSAQVYVLSAGSAQPQAGAALSLPAGGSFNVSLPAMSATLLVLQ